MKWDNLPDFMRTEEVEEYYNILKQKRGSLVAKRVFDIVMSLILLVVLSPFMLIIAIAVKGSSPGEVIFRQTRVTTYGKRFQIYKFRTMVSDAPQKGSQVTVSGDSRVTGVGHFLRKVRLDELPQLVNILKGEMSFVGTRPEVEKYVDAYTKKMYATLLMPAGVTSPASIEYKDEERLLNGEGDPDKIYIEQILPEKMKYNLDYIRNFSFWKDLVILIQTVVADLTDIKKLCIIILVSNKIILQKNIIDISTLNHRYHCLQFLSDQEIIASLLPYLIYLCHHLRAGFQNYFLIYRLCEKLLNSQVHCFFCIIKLIICSYDHKNC